MEITSDIKFKNKDDKHLACVLLFDVSGSMEGRPNTPEGQRPIDALNKSLMVFKEAFKKGQFGKDKDKNNSLSGVDLCIMSFGGKEENGKSVSDIQTLQPFAPATEMSYTNKLEANGGTPLAEAVEQAMQKIEDIKAKYRKQDVDYFRPILICVTDGESTETSTEVGKEYYRSVKESLKEAVKKDKLVPYGFGVGDCDMDELKDFFGNVADYTDKDFDESFMNMLELLGRSFVAKPKDEGSDIVDIIGFGKDGLLGPI